MYINRQSAHSLVKELGVTPILETEGGVIVLLDKHVYHGINAHSKHRLEPALKTGVDYEHAENDEKQSKDSESMRDGELLHCLTLEAAEFDARYRVQPDFDSEYKGYPLYFKTLEEMRTFISAHNEKHKSAVDACLQAVKAFNEDQKSEVNTDIDFDALPSSFQVGEVGKRSHKKCFLDYEQSLLAPVDLSIESGTALDTAVEAKYRQILNNASAWLDADFSKKWKAAKGGRDKGRLLNQVINEEQIKFGSLESDDDKLALIPTNIKKAHFTAASMKAAVKSYIDSQKQDVFYIDPKAPLDELVEAVKKYGLNMGEHEDLHLTKIPTFATKHPTKGTWQPEDILAVITKLYGKPAFYKPILVGQQEALAEEEKRTLVSAERYEHAKRIVAAVYNDPEANKWLTLEDNMFEVAVLWNDPLTGDLCKMQADVMNLTYNVITDIKFVNSVDFDKLERQSSGFNYHIQNAMYERGFNQVIEPTAQAGMVAKLNKFVFIAVEKDAAKLGGEVNRPIRIRVTEYIDRSDIERANTLIDAAIFRVNKWFILGEFEGFKGITGIRVPVYQRKLENMLLDDIAKERAEFEELMASKGIDPVEALKQKASVHETDAVAGVDCEEDSLVEPHHEAVSTVTTTLPRPDQLFT